MKYEAKTIEEYFSKIPDERKPALTKLLETIRDNIPEGFAEELGYGMPGFVVPHSIYPDGYHCDPKQALPFIPSTAFHFFPCLLSPGRRPLFPLNVRLHC